MFKMLPKAKFKLKQLEVTPPIPILTPGKQTQSLIPSKTIIVPKKSKAYAGQQTNPKAKFLIPKIKNSEGQSPPK